MLFVLFVIIFVLGIVGAIYESNRCFKGDTAVGIISCISVGVSAIAPLISLVVFMVNFTCVEADVAADMQQYESLVYQLENNVYDNDNDIGKRELYEDIASWNESIASKKISQRSFWLGIYIPNIYDDYQLIEWPEGK